MLSLVSSQPPRFEHHSSQPPNKATRGLCSAGGINEHTYLREIGADLHPPPQTRLECQYPRLARNSAMVVTLGGIFTDRENASASILGEL